LKYLFLFTIKARYKPKKGREKFMSLDRESDPGPCIPSHWATQADIPGSIMVTCPSPDTAYEISVAIYDRG
jgi:hypothetical protein